MAMSRMIPASSTINTISEADATSCAAVCASRFPKESSGASKCFTAGFQKCVLLRTRNDLQEINVRSRRITSTPVNQIEKRFSIITSIQKTADERSWFSKPGLTPTLIASLSRVSVVVPCERQVAGRIPSCLINCSAFATAACASTPNPSAPICVA